MRHSFLRLKIYSLHRNHPVLRQPVEKQKIKVLLFVLKEKYINLIHSLLQKYARLLGEEKRIDLDFIEDVSFVHPLHFLEIECPIE